MPRLSEEKQNKKKEVKPNIDEMAATLKNMSKSEIPTDVMGSYTGTSRDDDKPIQDVDDL